MSAEVVPPTTEQLTQALGDESRQGDWFSAGAEVGATEASHRAMESLCNALLGLMYETGFPPVLFFRMISSKVEELDRRANADLEDAATRSGREV